MPRLRAGSSLILCLALSGCASDSAVLLTSLEAERVRASLLTPGSAEAQAIPRPGLKALTGRSRLDVEQALGAPDYCGHEPDCRTAPQAAFYFFKPDPSPPDRPGRWVLLLYFDDRGRVREATWYDAGGAAAP